MARPTKMTGWWLALLQQRCNGSVALLADLCKVSVRTIFRWYTGDIEMPDLEKRKVLQKIAGPDLLKHPQCPKYLRFRIVSKPATTNPRVIRHFNCQCMPANMNVSSKDERSLAEILADA